MIFNITGGGGSGAALNFNVVAYATEEELLAATPSENTIGVITETPITSWIFSSTEPNPATPGMMWVFTSPDSSVPFNALKKNNIQVYPMNAEQYIGGTWVGVTAKTYQSGVWLDWWNGELFVNGNQYAHVTGGWVEAGYQLQSGDGTAGTLTIGTEIVLAPTGASSNCKAVRTANKIDLTSWSRITCTVNQQSGSGRTLLISKSTSGYANNTSQIPASTQLSTLDISGFTGEYYIGAYARVNSGQLRISKITLER